MKSRKAMLSRQPGRLNTAADKRRVRGTRGVYACPECWCGTVGKGETCPVVPGHVLKPIYFHSTGEFRRWHSLLLLLKLGKIKHLRRQVPYSVEVSKKYVFTYYADFVYWEPRGGEDSGSEWIVEDFKGWGTDISKLKRKIVEAYYDIKILITGTKT